MMKPYKVEKYVNVIALVSLAGAGIILTLDKHRPIVVIIGILTILYAILDYVNTSKRILKLKESTIMMDSMEKEMKRSSRPLTKGILEEAGFSILETKDAIYANHPNGVAMTHEFDHRWRVQIRDGKLMWADTVTVIGALEQFCLKHNKPIKPNYNDSTTT